MSLGGAVEARKLGLIEPILVGPPARIRDVAARYGFDITDLPIVESAHSHDSAAKAVALVREAKAGALMKGSLHTDELMAAVSPEIPASAPSGGSAIASSWTSPVISTR